MTFPSEKIEKIVDALNGLSKSLTQELQTLDGDNPTLSRDVRVNAEGMTYHCTIKLSYHSKFGRRVKMEVEVRDKAGLSVAAGLLILIDKFLIENANYTGRSARELAQAENFVHLVEL